VELPELGGLWQVLSGKGLVQVSAGILGRVMGGKSIPGTKYEIELAKAN
jgi:hypothetical protein